MAVVWDNMSCHPVGGRECAASSGGIVSIDGPQFVMGVYVCVCWSHRRRSIIRLLCVVAAAAVVTLNY